MSDPPKPRLPRGPWGRLPLVVLALGCATEPPPPPEASTPDSVPIVPSDGFRWGSATPESQGMCGSATQLGCTKTLEQIWNSISDPKHNTKRFVVIRNDKVI